jgi:hypothetical protein
VRGAGVENSDRRVGEPGRGFPRGIVGEAKERDVCVFQGLAAGRRILALRFRKDDDFKIVSARKPITDPKGCRSRLAIDVKFGSHSITNGYVNKLRAAHPGLTQKEKKGT